MTKQKILEAEMRRVRAAQDAVLPHIAATPAAVNDATALIRAWTPGTMAAPVSYTARDVRVENGVPYSCKTAHTHHGEPGWNPSAMPTLWLEYHGTSVETARPYRAPGEATEVYRVGEYMIWTDGKVYRCKADTDRAPDVLPGNWEVVSSSGGGETPEPPDEPDPETPAMPKAWDDFPANHAFQPGDEFSDGGVAYVVKRAFFKQDHMRPPALTGDYYVVKT